MSLNNDYTTQLWWQQHHQELMAVAANDRLVRIALSGRPPWWRRHSRSTPANRRAATPGARLTTPGQRSRRTPSAVA